MGRWSAFGGRMFGWTLQLMNKFIIPSEHQMLSGLVHWPRLFCSVSIPPGNAISMAWSWMRSRKGCMKVSEWNSCEFSAQSQQGE